MLLYQSYKLHKISKIYKRAMKRKNRKCLGKMVVVLQSVLSSDTKLVATLTYGMPAFSLYITYTKLPIYRFTTYLQPFSYKS